MGVPLLSELCFNVIINTEGFVMLNGDALKKLPAEVVQQLLRFMLQSVQTKLITQVVPLKIRLMRQNRLVTFKFKLHGTVKDTVTEIYEKFGGGVSTTDNVSNYGLFQSEGKHSRWLREDRSLSFYNLKSGEILDFKIKQNLIKVEFLGPWPTVKTFIVDESKTVADLTAEIGGKIGLKNPEEFSLQVRETGSGVSQFNWLNPNECIPEQGVDMIMSTFFLRKKYFFRDLSVNEVNGNENLTRCFCQCLDAILTGTNPCTLEEATRFAALQCQIRFGDCDSENPEFLEHLCWEEYLPLEYVPLNKKIEKEILKEYKNLNGSNESHAKFRYMQMSKSLKTYGYTFFKAEKINKEQSQRVLIGISKGNIMLLEAESKDTLYRQPLPEVVQWKVLHNTLTIYYYDHTEEFVSRDAQQISQVLADYINFVVGIDKSSNKSSEFRPGSPTSSRPGSPTSSRPGSPPLGLSVKERELIVRKVTAMRKRPATFTESTNAPFPNPRIKRCPLYIEPAKIHLNPLFTDGMSLGRFQPNDESNYYLKLLRSLSCLKVHLGKEAPREREIKVKFPDKSVKSFVVDEMKTVYDIAYEIGEKVGIKNPDEFSLQREDEVWLNPYQSLRGQEVQSESCILFKKKFHYHDALVNSNDPVYFNLLFCQSHDAIVSGLYPCTLNEAVQLAATQFQINFGDHNPSIHKPGFLNLTDLKFFLPPDWLEDWGVTFLKLEKLIYKEHQKLRGIKEEYAKFRYLQLCRSLSTYGTVFFEVKLNQHNGKSHVQLPYIPISLGFSRDSISFMTAKTKKVLVEYPFTHLRKWEGTPTDLKLDFGDYEEGYFIFSTTEGETISKYLSDYLDFIQKTTMATHTFNTQLTTYPPENPENNFFLIESNWVCCWENGKRVFTSTFWD